MAAGSPPPESSAPAGWLDLLEGAPAALQLPTDHPRPSSLPPATATTATGIGDRTRAQLDELAGAVGTDLGAVLLSAWQVLLARHADQTDLVVGVVPAELADSDHVLVVRSTVEPTSPFRKLLAATAGDQAQAAERPVTVSELLAALRADAGAGRHPVFQVAVRHEQAPDTGHPDGYAPCDLVLSWRRLPDGVEVALTYATALFDAASADRLLARLGVLIDAIAADPDQGVGSLDLLTSAEAVQLAAVNDTSVSRRPGLTVAALVAEQVERTPDAVAVELGDDALTYRQLSDRAGRWAAALADHGVGPGTTVGVSLDRSIDLAVAVLAVLTAGGAYVPIDPAYPAARRAQMAHQGRIRVLVTHADLLAGLDAPDGTEVLTVDQLREAPDAAAVDPAVGEEDLGYVIFTSGSTGRPKGVALPQRALTNLIQWQLARPDFAAGARTLQFASLSFDVSFQELFTTWCSGGTLVLVPDATRRDPRGLLEHVVRHRVERLFLPFVALRGLAEAAGATGSWPTALREVYTAGEQLRVDQAVRRFFTEVGCLLENQYGPSESHVVTVHRLGDDPASWPALPPIGRPIDNATVHVVDRQGAPAPVGVPGELYLGGRCLASGYLGQPDLTAERFRTDLPAAPGERVYRTGDLARWDADGELQFLGRIDHQVKFRGFRIEPGEVAAVLADLPGVRQCVASVVELPQGGARLAAYLVPRIGEDVDLTAAHRTARDRLPDYMVPSHYVVLDELPLTASGKVDTAALPPPAFDRRILETELVKPRTDTERRIAAIWEELLGVPEIGVHDDFFDLGGDSLMAVDLFLRLGEQFDHDLPLGALAQAPTVAGLARLLDGGDAPQPWRSLVPVQVAGDRTPLFFVHGGSGNVASAPRLARALPPDRPLYGLQWDGLDGRGGARTLEAMASRYVAEIRSVQPAGPYLLAGQCIGGLVAREIARQLRADGDEVALLVMYESPNLASPHYRLSEGLPPFPAPVAPLLRRLVGFATTWFLSAKGVYDWRQVVRVRVRDRLRRTIAPEDRTLHSTLVMSRAVWRYRYRPLPVRTLYINTGDPNAWDMALAGKWDDGLLGWSPHVSPTFEVHHVEAEHNDVPFAPEGVAVLRAELERIGR